MFDFLFMCSVLTMPYKKHSATGRAIRALKAYHGTGENLQDVLRNINYLEQHYQSWYNYLDLQHLQVILAALLPEARLQKLNDFCLCWQPLATKIMIDRGFYNMSISSDFVLNPANCDIVFSRTRFCCVTVKSERPWSFEVDPLVLVTSPWAAGIVPAHRSHRWPATESEIWRVQVMREVIYKCWPSHFKSLSMFYNLNPNLRLVKWLYGLILAGNEDADVHASLRTYISMWCKPYWPYWAVLLKSLTRRAFDSSAACGSNV